MAVEAQVLQGQTLRVCGDIYACTTKLSRASARSLSWKVLGQPDFHKLETLKVPIPFFDTTNCLSCRTISTRIWFSDTVRLNLEKTLLWDHLSWRTTILSESTSHISMQLNLSPKTTCLERPYFCGQRGQFFKLGPTVNDTGFHVRPHSSNVMNCSWVTPLYFKTIRIKLWKCGYIWLVVLNKRST